MTGVGFGCLSYIAHNGRIWLQQLSVGLTRSAFRWFHGIQRRRIDGPNCRGAHAMHGFPGILEFPSALNADLIGTPSNGEHAAETAVMAAEQRFQYPQRRFHDDSHAGELRLPSVTYGDSQI